MIDRQTLTNQITGLQGIIKGLRERERTFIKVNTIQEQIEIARSKVIPIEEQLAAKKKEVEELRDRKANSLTKTAGKLAKAITKLLPSGEAAWKITDEEFSIGWNIDGEHVTPYEGLSGGEKALFDVALSNALLGKGKNKVLIVEAAEIDNTNLAALLDLLAKSNPEAQIIVITCHTPAVCPKEWKVVQLQ